MHNESLPPNRVVGPDGLLLELLYEPARQPAAPRRTPLLFVHGAFAGAWSWQVHYLPYFAGLGYDSYALSLRGHGGSAGGASLATVSLSDYVNDVKTVAAQFAVPPVLIGHSMGGLVVDMAVRRRVNAAGAILLAAVPPTGMGAAVMRIMVSDPAQIWQMTLLQTMGPEWVDMGTAQRAVFADPPEQEQMAIYLGQMNRESQLALTELGFPSLPSSLCSKVPISVVGAEADALVAPWMVATTAWLHGVKPEWIAGSGHVTMLEKSWLKGAEVVTKCLGALGSG